jgi:hypothetical protein
VTGVYTVALIAGALLAAGGTKPPAILQLCPPRYGRIGSREGHNCKIDGPRAAARRRTDRSTVRRCAANGSARR